MEILILFRYFWPESRVAEEPHMLREVVKMHLARGDQVRVVCGSAEDCQARWAEEFPVGVRFTWFRAAIDRDGPLWMRMVNCARLLTLGVAALLPPRSLALVYVFAYPPGVAGAIIFLCRLVRRRTRVILSFQDNLEYRIPGRVPRALYRAYNRFCLRHATCTVVLSEEMRSHLLQSFPAQSRARVADRIKILNNFYAEDVPPVEPGRQTVYDVIYAGNHGPGQNLRFFLRVLARCQRAAPLRVVFFGNGTDKHGLLQLNAELNAGVEFREPIGRQQIAKEMRSARFGLVAMRPDLSRYAFPSKIAAYTCNGTPALLMSDPAGNLGRWISREQLGAAINPENEAQAADQLNRLVTGPGELAPSELAARARELFGKDHFLRQLEEIVNKVTAGKAVTPCQP